MVLAFKRLTVVKAIDEFSVKIMVINQCHQFSHTEHMQGISYLEINKFIIFPGAHAC